MNDVAGRAPQSRGGSAAGLVIRPASPGDAARVARLLALRGTGVEDALAQAPRMIEALPVLLLALMPVEQEAEAGTEEVGDDRLAPVALSGAFVLPGDLGTGRPERWTVSGLVVDPRARRHGIGRALLSAVVDAVAAIDPGEPVVGVVNTDDHALIGLHLAVGFTQTERVEEYAGVTFEGGWGVVMVHGPAPGAAGGPGGG